MEKTVVDKKELMNKKPQELELVIPVPKRIKTERGIAGYTWRTFNFDIGYDYENDTDYEKLYYNEDLRSEMGLVLEWFPLHVVIFPKYFAGDLSDKTSHWTKGWRRLIKKSEIVNVKW